MRASGRRRGPGGRGWLVATAAGLGLVAVTASACGHGAGTQVATDGKPMTAAALAAAASDTSNAGTGHVTMSEVVTSSGESLTIRASGDFDDRRHSSEMEMVMPAMASLPAGTLRERKVDGHAYVQGWLYDRLIPVGKSWVEVAELSKLARTTGLPGATDDGTSYLQALEGMAGAVTRVGTEPIDGQPTTHYRAQIDVTKMLAKVPADVGGELRQAIGAVQGDLPVDVWVGADGLVHRIVVTLSITGATEGSSPGRVVVSETLSRFGQPVDVVAPAADQVALVKDLSGLTH